MNMNKIMQKIDAIKFHENREMISLSNLKKEIAKIERQHNIKYNSDEAKMIWYHVAHKYNIQFNYEIARIVAEI